MNAAIFDEYTKFSHSFLDTIDIKSYVQHGVDVNDTMNLIRTEHAQHYKDFCQAAKKEGTLPECVKEEDGDFDYIFNVMDEYDFIDYVENRLGGKYLTYEEVTTRNYWR